ncbi:hypothetical protein [Thermosynechococcus sp.]|uniref:hypothetical protein n=1 Tax=Thermosynechococcus sp. TaxID=2814275 RepID=UPI00391929AA
MATLGGVFFVSAVFLPITGTLAQGTSSEVPNIAELVRARNYARQAAERVNGGLSRYRADASMYAPYVRNADGSYTFRILGYGVKNGVPQPLPSIETVVTVAPDGRTTVNYNGVIRN